MSIIAIIELNDFSALSTMSCVGFRPIQSSKKLSAMWATICKKHKNNTGNK